MNQPLPPKLRDEVLARRETLPLKPAPVTLCGQHVRLQPLDVARDGEALFRVSNGDPITLGDRHVDAYDADALIWRYMFDEPFGQLDAFCKRLQAQVDAPNGACFCVVDLASEHPVGVVNLMNNSPEHLKIELGGIWYSPIVQRTHANLESTYLLLCHVFELGYRRAEWKCHSHNERSRRSALRMGFQFEGIQEGHMIIKGRNRDTAWFRILQDEWPAVRQRLEQMLAEENGASGNAGRA